ncbi:type I-U CRISPR-associated protein Cas7 [Corynebacterium felinum]|uniref:CRISPR-associated protein Csb1 n=1 Tax=Corynebacterium felinum TaxID=131318 RepID=A0ABU2BDQ9_9CORY|nr:type I-U CRISPR-associated protein Cas7 [Corynebacterium felinum]MDF5820706.1 type I-U CRISPR-associated protein Cas7 [Corynebacterium felinum]MDR7355519.1 CRISPR-associated protein Csb1 [Corynebacterium felinum]WJY94869.1 CRISPR-associated protein [Corynebacterium felinum]
MTTTLTHDLLLELAADRNAAIILCDTTYEPAAGVGSPIAPATYAKSESKADAKKPSEPAFTERTVLRKPNSLGFHTPIMDNDSPRIGSAVQVASVGDQATRVENALWAERDALDLPGIVLNVDESALNLAEEVFRNELKKRAKKFNHPTERSESYLPEFLRLMEFGGVSSWTAPHRHADAWLRTSIDPRTNRPVWAGGDLYNTIISGGPTNVLPLLKLSPNALLFGYWLSIGAPIAHKMARSFTASIIGYDAHKLWISATKGSPYPASGKTAMSTDPQTGEITFQPNQSAKNAKGFDSPSHFGFGMVPTAWSNKLVTCANILGSTTISLTGLRAAVAQDQSLNGEQKTAVVAALAALGIYGRILANENSFLRSGCDLIDTNNSWGLRRRGTREIDSLNIGNDKSVLLPTVKETLDHARKLGVFGSSKDRIYLVPSKQGLQIITEAILNQSSGSSKESD